MPFLLIVANILPALAPDIVDILILRFITLLRAPSFNWFLRTCDALWFFNCAFWAPVCDIVLEGSCNLVWSLWRSDRQFRSGHVYAADPFYVFEADSDHQLLLCLSLGPGLLLCLSLGRITVCCCVWVCVPVCCFVWVWVPVAALDWFWVLLVLCAVMPALIKSANCS